jgi:ubiquinone/menaquinone biosynthesis C-methylase UbiE
MQTLEQQVAGHYTHGSLEAAILAGLRAMGRDGVDIQPDDLAAIDEFHIGGKAATEHLAGQLALIPGMSVLDIGSGLGGAARFIAGHYGCRVTGLDLTPEYVSVATRLTELVGLNDRAEFRVGSALDLPFPNEWFDRATLLHVGMNIADKERLCREVYRVLKPGGVFALYDVMRTGDEEIDFPVPWAATPSTSFLQTPEGYRQVLADAGFKVKSERNRREMGIEFFMTMRARMAETGPPPLGLHILMGKDAPTKAAGMLRNLERGCIAPVEIIATKESKPPA